MELAPAPHLGESQRRGMIESALAMSEEEQRERMGRMTDAVERYTVKDWAEEQLAGFPQPVAP